MSRTSTTAKTAVEEMVISSAIARTIDDLSAKVHLNNLKGNTFFIKNNFEEKETVNIISNPSEQSEYEKFKTEFQHQVASKLLSSGLSISKNSKDADLLVIPTLVLANIDDNQHLFGLPSVPVPVSGGVGSVNTPELALLGIHQQFGRAKSMLTVIDNRNGTLTLHESSKVMQAYYTRWKLLFFLGWRTTDLPKPF